MQRHVFSALLKTSHTAHTHTVTEDSLFIYLFYLTSKAILFSSSSPHPPSFSLSLSHVLCWHCASRPLGLMALTSLFFSSLCFFAMQMARFLRIMLINELFLGLRVGGLITLYGKHGSVLCSNFSHPWGTHLRNS